MPAYTDHVDGCPSCVSNVEPPKSSVMDGDSTLCGYLCSDCGHAWTTSWRD